MSDMFIYGKVGIDIMPLTKGFGRELHRKLEAELADDRFEVPVGFDLDRGKYDEAKNRIEHDELHQKVQLDIDRRQVSERMKQLGAQKLTVGMDADTREFRRDMQREANRLEDAMSAAINRGFDIKSSTADRTLKKVQAELDAKHFQITPQVELDLGETERQIDRLKHRIDLSDKFDAEAEKIQLRAERLSKSIPALRLDDDTAKATAKLHALADKYKRNEHVSMNVRADVEADTREATRKLDRFERKHNELKMDIDLKTRTAAAHMAYFTRPRSVDIFARFKGTDMGKILNGMTSGATGLKGVENQFQKLVNLMDTLDNKVPKFATLGSMFITLAAGATNLAGSVGGAGKSIVELSKVAYAAPAVLGAAAGAFYGLYAAVKTAGDHVNLAGTAFENLQDKIGTRFWDEAAKSIKHMVNTIGPDFVQRLGDIAAREGDIASGTADIISQADEGKRINVMLEESATAVGNLTPGVKSLAGGITALGKEGASYLPQFTNWLDGNIIEFSTWAEEASKDNTNVDKAMQGVKEQAGYLGNSVKSLKDIFEGAFGTLAKYENGIQGFSETLDEMDGAVNSVRFQESMDTWIDGAQKAQKQVRGSFKGIGEDAYSLKDAIYQSFTDGGTVVSSTVSNASRLLAGAEPGMRRFTGGIAEGWKKATDAAGQSAPAFSSLLTMTGQLSSTFGGTLAVSLKAAAPLIQAIATGATDVAKAFDSLPEPVKAAIGLWLTFGKAGKEGLDSIKQGMLQNIQDTLRYRMTLDQLGITAKDNKTHFIELAKATAQLRLGDQASTLENTLPSLRQTSKEWHNVAMSYEDVGKVGGTAASATKSLGAASIEASATALAAGSNVGKFGGIVGKAGGLAKTTGSAILGALGGVPGLAVSAGIGLMTVAISDYNTKSESMQEASANVSEGIRNIATVSKDTSAGLSTLGEAIRKNLEDKNFADTGVTGWLSSLTNKFKDTASASALTGISLDETAKAAAGSKTQFQMLDERLQTSSGLTHDQAEAFDKQRRSLEAAQKQALENVKTTAMQNGYTSDYVQKLYDEGASLDQIAVKTQNANQLQQNAAQATKLLSQANQDHASATIRATSAGSQYESTLASIGDTTSKVTALASQGQQVWDSQAKTFDLTTEAGRTAADALGTLSTNSGNYLKALIESGSAQADVTAKSTTMKQAFYDTALQMTGNADAARQLTDQYNMTPKEIDTLFKAKTEEAKSDMMVYLALIRQTFPGKDGQAIYNTVLKAIKDGSINSIPEVQDLANKLTKAPYVTVLMANGDQLRMTVDDAKKRGAEFDGKTWRMNLDANDAANPKLQKLMGKMKEADGTKADLQLLLSGDQDVTNKLTNVEAFAKRLGLTKTQIDLIANTDNASHKLDAIREKLRSEGLSNKQIDILLDAIDHTRGKFDEAKKQKDTLGKPVNFIISADNGPAVEAISDIEGRQLSPKTLTMLGDAQDANAKFNMTQSLVFLDKTARMLGDNSDANSRFRYTDSLVFQAKMAWMYGNNDNAVGVFNVANNLRFTDKWSMMYGNNTEAVSVFNYTNSLGFADKWSMMYGNNQDVQNKMQQVRAYDGVTLANSNAAIYANTSPLWNNINNNIAGRTLTTAYIDVYQRNAGTVSAATGGEIHGPGTSTSDSIHTMLSDGEMVINAAATKRMKANYGPNILRSINSTGHIPSNAMSRSLDGARQSMRSAQLTANRLSRIPATAIRATGGGGESLSQSQLTAAVKDAIKTLPVVRTWSSNQEAAVALAKPMSKELGRQQIMGV
ncbi:MAG: hypothetical protein J6575_03460 [Bifidobacterium sp.]|nr:hypothetical protein [Bifidobacterium sp.]